MLTTIKNGMTFKLFKNDDELPSKKARPNFQNKQNIPNTNSLNSCIDTNTNINKNKNSHHNQIFVTPFNPFINPTKIQRPNINNETPYKQPLPYRQQQNSKNRRCRRDSFGWF